MNTQIDHQGKTDRQNESYQVSIIECERKCSKEKLRKNGLTAPMVLKTDDLEEKKKKNAEKNEVKYVVPTSSRVTGAKM